MSDAAAPQKVIESRIDRWLRVSTMLLPVLPVAMIVLFICWPVEGQIPFDSSLWKQSTKDPAINIRTRMKDDLVRRLKTERWAAQRAKDELGLATEFDNPPRLNYELGHRRGMWPCRSCGAMTGFDAWYLMIFLNESGVVQDAYAAPR